MKNEPLNQMEIPCIDYDKYEQNVNKYEEKSLTFQGMCACCGKGVKNPKYLINTIYGSQMYPANDLNEYEDSWWMPIGSTCVKKFPAEYVINADDTRMKIYKSHYNN